MKTLHAKRRKHECIWITNSDMPPANLFELVRQHWRIENGVFQPLKDHQGAKSDHNYDRCSLHLCTALTMLMMLTRWLESVHTHFYGWFKIVKAYEDRWHYPWETVRSCLRLVNHAS